MPEYKKKQDLIIETLHSVNECELWIFYQITTWMARYVLSFLPFCGNSSAFHIDKAVTLDAGLPEDFIFLQASAITDSLTQKAEPLCFRSYILANTKIS